MHNATAKKAIYIRGTTDTILKTGFKKGKTLWGVRSRKCVCVCVCVRVGNSAGFRVCSHQWTSYIKRQHVLDSAATSAGLTVCLESDMACN